MDCPQDMDVGVDRVTVEKRMEERGMEGVGVFAPSLPVTAAARAVSFFTTRQTEGVLRGADHHLGQWLLHDR